MQSTDGLQHASTFSRQGLPSVLLPVLPFKQICLLFYWIHSSSAKFCSLVQAFQDLLSLQWCFVSRYELFFKNDYVEMLLSFHDYLRLVLFFCSILPVKEESQIQKSEVTCQRSKKKVLSSKFKPHESVELGPIPILVSWRPLIKMFE